ncbi:MAG: hypothetical protein KDA92_08980 [Planctomycetales bacterium]|nr:hypothetical protein [Planctomycetales bacterium]MCA9168045.1 hypothetical protein [Planctomycetales bacterium]
MNRGDVFRFGRGSCILVVTLACTFLGGWVANERYDEFHEKTPMPSRSEILKEMALSSLVDHLDDRRELEESRREYDAAISLNKHPTVVQKLRAELDQAEQSENLSLNRERCIVEALMAEQAKVARRRRLCWPSTSTDQGNGPCR